jgi:ELWxxDGT repeat protein
VIDPMKCRLLGFSLCAMADVGQVFGESPSQVSIRKLKEINPSTVTSSLVKGSPWNSFANVLGIALFAAADGARGEELWRSDGTEGGTTLVKDIRPGSGSSAPGRFVVINSQVFFAADDGVHGVELWKSNGTAEGTVLVKDIRPGGGSSLSSPVLYPLPTLVAVDGALFFVADDGVNGRELWRSDGTDAGTALVKDIRPGGGAAFPTSSPVSTEIAMISIGGTLFFPADDGASGLELWKSDGTGAGTVRVRDINPGPASSEPFGRRYPYGYINTRTGAIARGATLFFTADDGSSGLELWKSDGTEAGTIRVMDIRPGPAASDPTDFAAIDDSIFFTADDGAMGREMWKSDGRAGGTLLVKDIMPGALGSLPGPIGVLNRQLYFSATDAQGPAMWRSDGTAAGTSIFFESLTPYGTRAFGAGDMTPAAGTLVFAGSDTYNRCPSQCGLPAHYDGHGSEPWVIDGTAAGTRMLSDIQTGIVVSSGFTSVGSSYPHGFTRVGSRVFFAASDGRREPHYQAENYEPWVIELNDVASRYRLYHDGTKEHLYTTDANEYAVLGSRGWVQEGIDHVLLRGSAAFLGITPVPLYRLYHAGIKQHLWTRDKNEYDTLPSGGWSQEGIDGYVLPAAIPGTTTPLYRLAFAHLPLHLWTTDRNEYDVLPRFGWIQEGTVGHVIPR